MPDKILVIEDNPITRKLLQLNLEAEGFEVNAIGLAADVDGALAARPPDLVLLDLKLPDSTGFEVLERIRASHPAEQLPVVAVSGLADEQRILAAGFTDHLVKPVEAAVVVERVRIHLRAARGTRRRGRRILVVDDDAAQLELTQLGLAAAGFEVAAAHEACEALSIAHEVQPEVIISDIAMPGVDGFQLCRAVRLDPELSDIPVVLASSRQLDRADRERGVRAGAAAVVTRTPDLGELTSAVREHASPHTISRAITRPELPSNVHREVIGQLEQQAQDASQSARAMQIWKATLLMLERICELSETARDPRELLDQILAGLLDVSGFALGLIFRAEDGGLTLSSELGVSRSERARLVERFGNRDVLQRVLDGGRPVALDCTSPSHIAQQLLAGAGVGSMLLVPLVRRGAPIAIIALASPNTALARDWLELATAVTGPIVQALMLAGAPAAGGHTARAERAASVEPEPGGDAGRAMWRAGGAVDGADRRAHPVADAAACGLVLVDEAQVITYANPAACALLGTTAVVGQPASAYLAAGASAGDAQQVLCGPANQVPVEVTARRVEDGTGRTLFTLHALAAPDERATLARLANHDLLTGLLNRERFDEALEARLSEARRYGMTGALLLLDIEHLARINDRFGRATGDAVLRRVGSVLASTTRATDIRGRLGDDDFALVLLHTTRDGAERCARKILARLDAPSITCEDTRLGVAACIGVALFPKHGTSRHDIVSAAQGALYRARRDGSNPVCVHDGNDIVIGLTEAPPLTG